MKTRIISSVVAIIITFLICSQFFNFLLNAAAIIIYGIALYEIYHAFKKNNSVYIFILLFILGSVRLATDPYTNIINNLILPLFALSIAAIIVFHFPKIDFITVGASTLFSLFVLFGIDCIVKFKYDLPYENVGWDACFMFFLVAAISWGGDTMAYFAGYFFGKNKLSPILSPKKTIEGAIGGILGSVSFTVLALYIYCYLKPILEGTNEVYTVTINTLIFFVVVAIIGSPIGMIGDLFASAVKRQTGIKDYGFIMPGHGGILDRFDSVLLVAPYISIVSGYILQTGGVFGV